MDYIDVEIDEVEVYDEHGASLTSQRSMIEEDFPIGTYSELMFLMKDNAPDLIGDSSFGDNKSFVAGVASKIWLDTLITAHPVPNQTDYEEELLTRVYRFIFYSYLEGLPALPLKFCNYMNIQYNDFKLTLNNPKSPNHRVYLWVHNILLEASSMNQLVSNGNPANRQWIDSTQDDIIRTDERWKLNNQRAMIDTYKDHGEKLLAEKLQKELMVFDDE